jgi:nitric oxide reductase subunit C
MPNLGITEEEARATVAFLKWMSAIDTNGFPTNFQPIDQADAAPEAAPEAATPVEAAADADAVAAPAQQ